MPRAASWVVLACTTVLCALPRLTHAELPWGADLTVAAQLTQGMLEGLSDGQVYPRWIDGMSRGFGAPAFVFYPPLPYYASALAALATGEVVSGLKIVVVAALFLSGLACFVAARPLSSEWGAAAGAALYIAIPYHLLDLYDRFALAELCGFVLTPLLFRFARDVAERPGWGAAFGLTAAYAALLFTHVVTPTWCSSRWLRTRSSTSGGRTPGVACRSSPPRGSPRSVAPRCCSCPYGSSSTTCTSNM